MRATARAEQLAQAKHTSTAQSLNDSRVARFEKDLEISLQANDVLEAQLRVAQERLIILQKEINEWEIERGLLLAGSAQKEEVLSLLALLLQKYRY